MAECIYCIHAILEQTSATNARIIGCDCRECEEDECRFVSCESEGEKEMRYYSEDVVDGIIDDAIQYGIEIDAGGIGERPIASHYPSVSSNWHTGIPTEEGDYVLRLKFQNLRWDVVHYKDGKFMSYHDHRIDLEDIIKWQKIEETD